MVADIAALCKFIHAAQCERGLSVLYLQGKRAGNLRKFANQSHEMDDAWQRTENNSNGPGPLAQIGAQLPKIRDYRAKIADGTADLAETFRFYSGEIIGPAIDAVAAYASTNPAYDPARVSAFINLLHWKERAGQERAVGVLIADGAQAPNENNRLIHLISEMAGYERMFLALADDTLRQHYERSIGAKPAFKQIAGIEEAVSRGGTDKVLAGITADDWFDLLSARMDLLQTLALEFITHLPVQSGLAAAAIDPALSPNVTARLEDLKALPLLKGLNAECLLAVLQEARLNIYDRGALIFMQGEPADRFYVVLEGWVKLLKGNADGDESVIEVLTSGDGLSEVAIFRDSFYPVTAEAVEKAVLMSLPAHWVRARIKKDKDFAINMLAAAANRSKSLISQFEQLTLKNVTQRVGRFLLKQFLESGAEKTQLKLPLEKSVIAAYLGMKPETFSRTLQALRNQGISIEKNVVTLPDALALCTYCDMELAGRCPRSNTDACPDPDCAYS